MTYVPTLIIEKLCFKKKGGTHCYSILMLVTESAVINFNQITFREKKNEGSAAATKSQILLESGIVIFG